MRKDADFLLGQELKQLRQDLIAQTVDEATTSRRRAHLQAFDADGPGEVRRDVPYRSSGPTPSGAAAQASTGYEAVAKGGAS